MLVCVWVGVWETHSLSSFVSFRSDGSWVLIVIVSFVRTDCWQSDTLNGVLCQCLYAIQILCYNSQATLFISLKTSSVDMSICWLNQIAALTFTPAQNWRIVETTVWWPSWVPVTLILVFECVQKNPILNDPRVAASNLRHKIATVGLSVSNACLGVLLRHRGMILPEEINTPYCRCGNNWQSMMITVTRHPIGIC